jgi:hypothetical protein
MKKEALRISWIADSFVGDTHPNMPMIRYGTKETITGSPTQTDRLKN